MFQLSRTWYLRSSRNDRLHFAHYRIREDLLCRTFGRYHAVLGDGVRKIRIQFEDYFDDRSSTCSFHWQHSRTCPETRQVDIFRRGKRIVVETLDGLRGRLHFSFHFSYSGSAKLLAIRNFVHGPIGQNSYRTYFARKRRPRNSFAAISCF